jgi:hypothetical protein
MTLQRRLRRIPPGLRPYFKHMFDHLDQFYKAETAQIFRTVVVAPEPLPPLVLSTIFSTDPMAAKLLSDMRTRLNESDSKKLEKILGRRMVGCCGDLLEIKTFGRKGWTIQFLHRTVKEFLANDDMTAELDERAGKDFDIDATMCRVSLIELRYGFKRFDVCSRIEGTEQLFATFFSHARQLEEKTNQPPTELFEDLQMVTFSDELPALERLHLLAGMNMPLEFDRTLREVSMIESKPELTSCAMDSLAYLVGEVADKEHETMFNVRTMVTRALKMDPDRRGFRLEILTSLLKYGANPTEIWHWALPLMRRSKECTRYRRSMYFKVSSELISAGARTFGKSPDLYREELVLERVFGRSDAQQLLSLRKESAWQASWLSWFTG